MVGKMDDFGTVLRGELSRLRGCRNIAHAILAFAIIPIRRRGRNSAIGIAHSSLGGEREDRKCGFFFK